MITSNKNKTGKDPRDMRKGVPRRSHRRAKPSWRLGQGSLEMPRHHKGGVVVATEIEESETGGVKSGGSSGGSGAHQLRSELTDVDSVSPGGPFGADFVSIPKVNGGIVVKGPNARGDETAVAHGVEGGIGGSITVAADWRMSRVGGGDEPTEEERRAGRRAVVTRLAEAPPRSRPGTAHASSFLFPRTPQRTTMSQRATQANNQMVPDGKGGFEKRAKQKGSIGAAPGRDRVGKPFDSGTGAAARDFSREGADKRYYGLHLNVPMTELAAELARLVQEDGRLLEEEGKPLPLCSTDVAPGYPGRTKGKGLFGLSREVRLVMGTMATSPTRA
eukprot:g6873.t1